MGIAFLQFEHVLNTLGSESVATSSQCLRFEGKLILLRSSGGCSFVTTYRIVKVGHVLERRDRDLLISACYAHVADAYDGHRIRNVGKDFEKIKKHYLIICNTPFKGIPAIHDQNGLFESQKAPLVHHPVGVKKFLSERHRKSNDP